MKRSLRYALLASALFWAGSSAGAEPPQPRPTTAAERGSKPTSEVNPLRPVLSSGAPAARPTRVHASHRVDVIAPGEKVETILDRMRADRPALPVDGTRAAPPPVRSMDRHDPQNPAGAPGSGPGPGHFPTHGQPSTTSGPTYPQHSPDHVHHR
jgi:hypothetical protein